MASVEEESWLVLPRRPITQSKLIILKTYIIALAKATTFFIFSLLSIRFAVAQLIQRDDPFADVGGPFPILGEKLEFDADLLALAAAVVPAAGARKIARLFKVQLGPDGFFQEAHVKLWPVEFAADGVFLCGMAHYPKNC